MPEIVGPLHALASAMRPSAQTDLAAGTDLAQPLDRVAIASVLREIGAYLRLEGEPFRARAYQLAAQRVAATPELDALVNQRRLTDLPGIGLALAGAILELRRTGSTGLLRKLRERWPRGLLELRSLPGVGDRKARQLYQDLGVTSLAALAQACRDGKVRTVRGFGAKTEANLLVALERGIAPPKDVLLLPEARELSELLVHHLAAAPGVIEAHPAGQVRRCQEVVTSLDLVAATEQAGQAPAVRKHLARHPLVLDVTETLGSHLGEGKGDRVRLVSGVPAVLHLSRPEALGVAMLAASSAPAHWRSLVLRAEHAGLAIEQLEGDEAAIYRRLDLPYLPPETREGDDELDAPDHASLGRLVTLADVRGAVHCHTTDSDGNASIEEMAYAAAQLGYEYLTISDHSSAASYAGGLDRDRLYRQWEEIDRVQERSPIRLLKGTEADILADGALDWPMTVLERFDVVIASIHQRHRLDTAGMTRRLVRALSTPIFKIWGHALGRLLGRRDPITVDIDAVLAAAAQSTSTAIEINGDPHRLDLEPRLVRRARKLGLRFVLSADAHSIRGLGAIHYAVDMARRARLTAGDVLNTASVADFLAAVRPLPR
jgi:DNA polymerase (family 10)